MIRFAMMSKFLTTLLLVTAATCFSQINTFYVKPIQTDINYSAEQDSHMVVRNMATNLSKLFLFIGGTGSSTQAYQTISHFAGNLGYDVINLSYPNTVAAASLSNSSDSMVFNQYRQEVCYGTALSPDVTVDTLNSIYTRTVKLIHYLEATYPTQNWDQYLTNPTTLNWSKIAVGGHSQGSGHACYFAKFNDVERVLMFSGPNDYSDYYLNAANWLRTNGITSMNKHFVYLSSLDEAVPFDKQLINLQALGLFPLYDTTYVDHANAPYNDSHCLYTSQTPGLALLYHNSTMKNSIINNEVWAYMLTSTIPSGSYAFSNKSDLSFYPNPTFSVVNISSTRILFNSVYHVRNVAGQIVWSGKAVNTSSFSIDLSSLGSGLYFVTIDKKTIKVFKQ